MNPLVRLTKQEQAIFERLLEGDSYKEIATYFAIKLPTVKKHVKSILDKYQSPSSLKLVVEWYQDQLHLEQKRR